MQDSRFDWRSAVLISAAGFISGLVTAALTYPSGNAGIKVLGSVFGIFIAVALLWCRVLRDPWRAILLPVATALALYLALFTAAFVEVILPSERFDMGNSPFPSPVALFAGGLVGAFLVMIAVSLLVPRGVPINPIALGVVCSSVCGGVLGVIGWALGPTLGIAVWSGLHSLGLTAPDETILNARGETSHMLSLFIVWQSGLAVIIALVLIYWGSRRAKNIGST